MTYDVYTASYCNFCVEAVSILVRQGCDFRVFNVTNDEETKEALTEATGCETLPQIFCDGEFIGGCSDLKVYFSEVSDECEE